MALLPRNIIYFFKLFLLKLWQIMLLTLKELQFQSFLIETEAQYSDVIYHNHIRWLNRETVVIICFDLRQKI